jgi:hypothetical protein
MITPPSRRIRRVRVQLSSLQNDPDSLRRAMADMLVLGMTQDPVTQTVEYLVWSLKFPELMEGALVPVCLEVTDGGEYA